MGNSSSTKPAVSSTKTNALNHISRQLVEDLWTVLAQDKLFISADQAVRQSQTFSLLLSTVLFIFVGSVSSVCLFCCWSDGTAGGAG
jgi:hypothetical protein